MTLCLIVEEGPDPLEGPTLHRRFVRRPVFRWLEPPQPNGRLTVADTIGSETPEEHAQAVRAWGRGVWDAWSQHHRTVRTWIDQSLS